MRELLIASTCITVGVIAIVYLKRHLYHSSIEKESYQRQLLSELIEKELDVPAEEALTIASQVKSGNLESAIKELKK